MSHTEPTEPPQQTPKPMSFLAIFVRGMAMGAADVVPGVSGGTIAYVSGIYDRLLGAIAAVPEALLALRSGGIAAAWRTLDGTFLLTLISGILLSIFSLAHGITWALHHYPIPVWGFFFGLILASIIYVAKQVGNWGLPELGMLIVGTLLVYGISVMPPLSSSSSLLFFFFAGALASCAMILPGISGSFVLLVIGVYAPVIKAVAERDLLTVGVVGMGAALGLIMFSRLLRYLLRRFHAPLLGLLTGFLVGSLWKIWPWKADPTVYQKGVGPTQLSELTAQHNSLAAYLQTLPMSEAENIKSYIQYNVAPATYALQNNLSSEVGLAAACAAFGAMLVLGLEKLGQQK